ncbi:hypothetical protein SAMN06272735_8057 [Streptomyces sp. TLI_55]|uniref:hypothetical protein n=1 Tax=Streptomyces sp. TLI_55 TaxID=1938861 RepID=UPI000BD6379B|nr:hypothetical protein [Streptomyces sp. TLI_55]SNX66211.1 hypothetical protein SAMN06272735_8057 [Streptomyces sp. TLI_55]
MADGNAYFANPGRIQSGVRQIDEISALARQMVREFVADVNLTRDWPGTDDEFAREVQPQEKSERTTVTDTGQSVSDAVVAVADGTHTNLQNIMGTQSGVLDAIHDSAVNGPGRH